MPGPRTPGRDFPGDDQPAEATESYETVTVDNIAIDATGTSPLGDLPGQNGRIVEVTVTPTAADFTFNVNAGGDPVFATAPSPDAAAEQSFTPNTGAANYDSADSAAFEVVTASATVGATTSATLRVAVEDR